LNAHRQEWKCLTVTNTVAYYSTESIMAVKSFIVKVPGVFATKPFFIIDNQD
jgi:hypothetical protein